MRKNFDAKPNETFQRVPTDRSEDAGSESQAPTELPSIWDRLKWLKERGLWKGEIEEYQKPFYNLNKGAHYFVMDNPSKRTIKCLSCPVSHGGILEPHLLTRYALNDGVLSLDGRPVNRVPESFFPPA